MRLNLTILVFCFISFIFPPSSQGAISLNKKPETTETFRNSKQEKRIKKKLRRKAGKQVSKLAIGAIFMGLGLLLGIAGLIFSGGALVYILAGLTFLLGAIFFVWDVVQIMN